MITQVFNSKFKENRNTWTKRIKFLLIFNVDRNYEYMVNLFSNYSIHKIRVVKKIKTGITCLKKASNKVKILKTKNSNKNTI